MRPVTMNSQNASHSSDNSSFLKCLERCTHNSSSWDHHMDQLYTYFYLIIFIPGLMGNSLALWVLCRFISKKNKAIIFMINLTTADLAHILSLPLRIYYYLAHTWPFGRILCLLCFYLKYLNMYASIAFLMCISIQRCVFLTRPFLAKSWRRRYDVCISATVWLLVGLGCIPLILMRSNSLLNYSCFKDLPTRQLRPGLVVILVVIGELLGFLLPLAAIIFCSCRISRSLVQYNSTRPQDGDSRKALHLVLACNGVFVFCFVPYHVNFPLYVMGGQCLITHCPLQLAVQQFHPVSICVASLNCCLNPVVCYFLTTEFRQQLYHQTSSMLRGCSSLRY